MQVLLTFLLLICTACVTGDSEVLDFDSHSLRLQFLSLFNQRQAPKDSKKTWRGDWLFRRERLNLIDKGLTDIKPDLIIFQDLLKRDSNTYESDDGILSSGILKGYKWHSLKTREYFETGEDEYLSTALIKPLSFISEKQEGIKIDDDNSVALDIVSLEKQNILLANIKLNVSINEEAFANILKTIKATIEDYKICSHRLIFAVSAPPAVYNRVVQISDTFHLQDSAKNFCNIEEKCFTANPRNQIYYQLYGEVLASRIDYILLSHSTKIKLSEINFNTAKTIEDGYYKIFGIDSLWPSDRYGWKTEFTLARCSN